ncbi:MAG: hypothetical protein GX790_10285 [Syntrophomonadaceae bacterium]|nr:hypothetical protein [Syntrophomonadaceae bacterium]
MNGKIYIGSHKTRNLNDNYMGSGKYLKYAQEKYGLENFEKEILYVFDTPELMYAKEAEIVNEDFIAEENTYNLKVGGFGGFDYLNSKEYNNPTHSDEHIRNLNNARKKKYPNGTFYGKTHSKETRLKIQKAVSQRSVNYFAGKTHTEETKRRMSESAKITSKGERNSQFGKRWIYSLAEKRSTRINKDDPLPAGWLEGRKIKF